MFIDSEEKENIIKIFYKLIQSDEYLGYVVLLIGNLLSKFEKFTSVKLIF